MSQTLDGRVRLKAPVGNLCPGVFADFRETSVANLRLAFVLVVAVAPTQRDVVSRFHLLTRRSSIIRFDAHDVKDMCLALVSALALVQFDSSVLDSCAPLSCGTHEEESKTEGHITSDITKLITSGSECHEQQRVGIGRVSCAAASGHRQSDTSGSTRVAVADSHLP